MGLFWRALGPFSLGSEQQFLRDVRKCCLGVFLGEKSTRLVLQKHANRTVHPSKIEGVLPTVQRLLHMFQRPYFGSQKLVLELPNSTQHLCSLAPEIKSSF